MSATALKAVEQFPARDMPLAEQPITDQLNEILAMLKASCPTNALISFDFDGQLHAHIDVRGREAVTVVEMVLPMLGGVFHSFKRSSTPHHPFMHRVSALVAR